MEIRNRKIIVSSVGGTAAKGSKTYKISLPSTWLAQMGISEAEPDLQICFDGERIVIQKSLSFPQFIEKKRALGHDIKLISYYDGDMLCTQICADFSDRTLSIRNYSDRNIIRAFGTNQSPSWNQFLAFLEERCIPRQRDGLRYYLDALGLDEYDPWQIVLRTGGRMEEDNQWLRVEDPE